MRIHGLPLAALIASTALVGCSRHHESTPSGTAESPAPAPNEPGPAEAPAAGEPEAPALVPAGRAAANVPHPIIGYDLSPAGPGWVGWSMRGMSGCQVRPDLHDAARIACQGANALDLGLKLSRSNLAEVRRNVERRAAEAHATLNFLVSTSERLEWTSTTDGATVTNFVVNYEIDHQPVSCASNFSVGIPTAAGVLQHKTACDSLRHVPGPPPPPAPVAEPAAPPAAAQPGATDQPPAAAPAAQPGASDQPPAVAPAAP